MMEWEKNEISIVANMALFYQKIGDYGTAEEIFRSVLEKAKKMDNGIIISNTIFSISWEILRKIREGEMGTEEREICKKMMKKAYYLSLARNDITDMKIFADYYKQNFYENIEEIL